MEQSKTRLRIRYLDHYTCLQFICNRRQLATHLWYTMCICDSSVLSNCEKVPKERILFEEGIERAPRLEVLPVFAFTSVPVVVPFRTSEIKRWSERGKKFYHETSAQKNRQIFVAHFHFSLKVAVAEGAPISWDVRRVKLLQLTHWIATKPFPLHNLKLRIKLESQIFTLMSRNWDVQHYF